jgi:hypothetical protein
MSYSRLKSVFVSAYTRLRRGKIEFVCQHWRSYPSQLVLFN